MSQYEVTQRFFFEAAHTLERAIETVPSRRVHGHTYQAEIAVVGAPSPETGMVVDVAYLREAIAELRERLDHHLLDEVEGLAFPTLEGLCGFIADRLQPRFAGLSRVRVWREQAGDGCTLTVRAAG
jgi:6-pyruvoyltetrahydropterin/6-carboxytetrahydropterin synthase